ncbi:MAG: IPT/TIG domain-containing protein, partial [Rufibacter sp.]
MPLEERMQTADLVVEVKVISQRSFWDSRHENIYTASQVEVYKVFKGVSPQGTIEVITEGGRVGLDLHILSNTLQLQPQQQGVLFLQKDKNYSGSAQYSVFGSLQGFIRYQVTDGTARDPFQRYASIPAQLYPTLTQLPGASLKTIKPNVELETALKRTNEVPAPTQRRAIPLITDFTPKSLRAGTGDVLTIRGTNFGATRGNGYVEFKNADDGGESYIKPLPTDYVSWTDTEIKVKVPTSGIDQGTAGTGTFRVVNNDPNTATSALELTIVFAYLNVTYEDAQYNIVEQSFQPVLIDQNGEGGYTFRFGASFESNRPALYSFKRAMNEWSCHTLINWNVASNRAVARATDDQINAVVFAAAGDIPANVLGRTTSRYKGCIQGANVTFYVSEIDMEFAQRNDWQYGPEQPTRLQYDFTSVAVHELGHGHQLSHLILPRAIMHYGVGRGQAARELNPENDIAGGNFVMARSTVPNLCQVAPMKPKPVNACAILVERLVLQGEYQSA